MNRIVNPINEAINTYSSLENLSANNEDRIRRNKIYDQQEEVLKQQKANAEQQRQQQLAMAYIGRQIHAKKNGLEASPTTQELDALTNNYLLNIDFLASDKTKEAVETAKAVAAGAIPFRSARAAAAINALSPDIQKGSPGKKSINQIIMGRTPGTVMFDLTVNGVPGKPLTERRSTDPNDPVKEVPVEDLLKRLQGVDKMSNMIRTPQVQQYLEDIYLDYIGKKRTSQERYGPIEYDEKGGFSYQKNLNTNEIKKLDNLGGNKSGPDTRPNLEKEMEYLKRTWKEEEGIDLTNDEAFQMANQAVSDPEGYIQDYVKIKVNAQSQVGSRYKQSIEEIENEAYGSLQRIQEKLSRSKPKKDGGNNPPKDFEDLPLNAVVIKNHPVHGDVKKADILTSMAKHNLTYDQLVQLLNEMTSENGVTSGPVLRE